MDITNIKILITGGNGYLGTFLNNKLKKSGAILYSISKNIENSEFNFQINLSDNENLIPIIHKINPNIVFHLAANLSRNRDFSIYNEMYQDNVFGTLNLLTALEQTDCEQFIFTSSSEIYGNNESPFYEDLIPKPVSPYSLTKVMAEMLIQTKLISSKMDYTIARIFNFYGPGMSEKFFISEMIQNLKSGNEFAMTKGEQFRDFLYIDDVVSALILMIQNAYAKNEIFNICSGKALSLKELAEEVQQHFPTRIQFGAIPYRENEVWKMLGNAHKIKSKLGFKPKVTLKQGILNLINQ